MTQHAATPAPFPSHGALALAAVDVDAYNAELRDAEGFIGDRASNRAFRAILEDSRERLRKVSDDPLGDTPTEDISKKKLDKVLAEGEPEAAGMIHGAIEEFARELSTVTSRFLRMKDWKGTERIVVGGGLRGSRVGELAIGRASVMLKSAGHVVDMLPIRHHPDHAGLLGTIHLAPSWIFGGYDSVLAVDIGGSNIRAGIVSLGTKKAADLSEAVVHVSELWRHCEDKPKRDEAVERLVKMLGSLMKRAEKDGLELAPFLGIGCPGVIEANGSISRGGQNLPGNWESSRFNLPALLSQQIPKISGHHTHVVMHNDAVVHGLSELPWMSDGDADHWGVLTIGTGLGNARFTNRPVASRM
jgi:predicted NBD/HSP70 family sugar kinase